MSHNFDVVEMKIKLCPMFGLLIHIIYDTFISSLTSYEIGKKTQEYLFLGSYRLLTDKLHNPK
jgi:hypothetical protein